MRRLNVFLVALMVSMGALYADNDRIVKDINELPEQSRSFLSSYYKNIPVSHIRIEKNLLFVESYDVILTDGTKIEFQRSGEWKEVKGTPQSIPAEIVPAYIQSYVRDHFAGSEIYCIDKDSDDIEVDLTNGIELRFDLKGNLLEIDR